jgi:hypothetical protein
MQLKNQFIMAPLKLGYSDAKKVGKAQDAIRDAFLTAMDL